MIGGVEVPSRVEIYDELWAEVEPLIPVRPRRRRYPGRKPIPDRLVLNGILHVLHTGLAWEDLPQEYGLLSTRFHPDIRLDRGGQDVGSHGGWDGRQRRRGPGC